MNRNRNRRGNRCRGRAVESAAKPRDTLLTADDLREMIVARCMGERAVGDEGESNDEELQKDMTARHDDVALENLVAKLIRRHWGRLDQSCFPDWDFEGPSVVVLTAISPKVSSSNPGKKRGGKPGQGEKVEESGDPKEEGSLGDVSGAPAKFEDEKKESGEDSEENPSGVSAKEDVGVSDVDGGVPGTSKQAAKSGRRRK